MKTKILTRDPDMVGSLAALRRAARVARKRAIEAGTPFIVMRKGKIVDGNAPKSSRSRGGRKKKSA